MKRMNSTIKGVAGRKNVILAALVILMMCVVVVGQYRTPDRYRISSTQRNVSSNPIGSGTIPPTRYQSGLVKSPEITENSGNLLVTGNVRGGMHFRGDVPYGSTTDFYGSMGSTYLDSFLRMSAGGDTLNQYRYQKNNYQYQPFYSQGSTVATQRGVVPNRYDMRDTRIATRPMGYGLRPLNSSETVLDLPNSARMCDEMGPLMSRTPGELEKIITNETHPQSQLRGLNSEQYQLEIRELQAQIAKLQAKMDAMDEEDVTRETVTGETGARQEDGLETNKVDALDDTPKSYSKMTVEEVKARIERDRGLLDKEKPADLKDSKDLRPSVPNKLEERVDPSTWRRESGIEEGSREDIKAQIDALMLKMAAAEAQVDSQSATDSADSASSTKGSLRDFGSRPSRYMDNAMRETMVLRDSRSEPIDPDTGERFRPTISSMEKLQEMSSTDIATRARRILGEHEDMESYHETQVKQYLQAGEMYMRQGRFYRASDSYRLALLYDSRNPLACAGKSHALFAAGEYMSSLLYLTRALDAFPEYAKHDVDFVGLIGAETIEKRVTAIRQQLEMTDVPELKLVLGYVYYRTGDMSSARTMLDAASEKLKGNAALEAIREAMAAKK